MEHEILNINFQNIEVIPGNIVFPEYESLKQQAMELAYNIEQVEVTEENIQISKKMIAAVSKRVREMEDKRIAIKKEILEPYNQFESQVKDIVNIVKSAENIVRDQLRAMEEKERDEKKAAIKEIFEKRMKHYGFIGMFGFDDFLQQQHLNKSVSMKSVETEMVDWLEKRDIDLRVIQGMPNNEAILTEYLLTKDMALAIQIVNEREERKKLIPKATKQNNAASYLITISDEKDFKLLELYMQSNNIKFTVEKVVI